MKSSLRSQVFRIVSVDDFAYIPSRIFNIIILFLILINVVVVLFESADNIGLRYKQLFEALKLMSIALFTFEYLLRLWSCPQHESNIYRHPVLGRLRYVFTPLMLMDLIAIAPFYANFPTVVDLILLRLFRFLSILDITRNSRALQLLVTVLVRESKTLVAIFLFISVLLVFISSIIFVLEHNAQPKAFGSIPDAMWWSMATLTTVGYGDIVPHTAAGKVFGMMVMFIGIAMFAVPTGILVSSFYQEVKRKDFIATWDLVAQVPFFSQLDAAEIARITDLLRLHTVRTGEVIFKKGEESKAMYFVVSGEVEIKLDDDESPKSVKGGDFFGEIGILYKKPRTGTVTAKNYVELLQLDEKDIEVFFESHPQLRERILEQAEIRQTNDHFLPG